MLCISQEGSSKRRVEHLSDYQWLVESLAIVKLTSFLPPFCRLWFTGGTVRANFIARFLNVLRAVKLSLVLWGFLTQKNFTLRLRKNCWTCCIFCKMTLNALRFESFLDKTFDYVSQSQCKHQSNSFIVCFLVSLEKINFTWAGRGKLPFEGSMSTISCLVDCFLNALKQEKHIY